MIPKIIHQIWEGKSEPLPAYFKDFAQTWKDNHPDWVYEFWDEKRMNDFISDFYPDFGDIYYRYPYSVQRWDVIRYLILFRLGGLYVDFDYESLESVNEILKDGTCFFAAEPEEHAIHFKKDIYFNNAFMACIPQHPFFKEIIEHLKQLSVTSSTNDKMMDVLNTTGPLMLTQLYETSPYKDDITLLPPELVSPWTKREVDLYWNDEIDYDEKELELKLSKAVAIHYFWGSW